MAVYKQEFFVPYLENLCGLYMAERQLTRLLENQPTAQGTVDPLRLERGAVSWLIHRAHQANVLPDSCRNIRCVYFLSTWFSGSGSDDLDHALRLYSVMTDPEELDRDIALQEQQILTRQYEAARPYRTIAQQHAYETDMKNRLHLMLLTSDEQLVYTKMIDITSAALAYFAGAGNLR